jgi:hypothetical protein
MGEDACVALVLFTPSYPTTSANPTIPQHSPQPRFTHVKRETYIVGMTLAVILWGGGVCLGLSPTNPNHSKAIAHELPSNTP